MKKVVKGKKLNLLKAKGHILFHAGMLVELMRILHYNRILEKALVPLRHDSHVVLKRNTVVMKNYGLAVRVAQRHYKDFIPMDDLKQYGAEGLIRAVDGFDPNKGYKFSSYAGACVKNAISRSVIEYEDFIRLPEHLAKEKKRKSREETRAQVKGVEPSQSSKKRERIVPEIAFSIDNCKKGDDGDKLVSSLVSENILSPEDYILQKSKEERRAQAVALLQKKLPERDWVILNKFYGITVEPVEISSIARGLRRSRQRVDTIKNDAIERSKGILFRNKISASSVL